MFTGEAGDASGKGPENLWHKEDSQNRRRHRHPPRPGVGRKDTRGAEFVGSTTKREGHVEELCNNNFALDMNLNLGQSGKGSSSA